MPILLDRWPSDRCGNHYNWCRLRDSQVRQIRHFEYRSDAGADVTVVPPDTERLSSMSTIAAQPYPFTFSPRQCALLIIDMQRDFLEPGGFGSLLGNDVQLLRRTIAP